MTQNIVLVKYYKCQILKCQNCSRISLYESSVFPENQVFLSHTLKYFIIQMNKFPLTDFYSVSPSKDHRTCIRTFVGSRYIGNFLAHHWVGCFGSFERPGDCDLDALNCLAIFIWPALTPISTCPPKPPSHPFRTPPDPPPLQRQHLSGGFIVLWGWLAGWFSFAGGWDGNGNPSPLNENRKQKQCGKRKGGGMLGGKCRARGWDCTAKAFGVRPHKRLDCGCVTLLSFHSFANHNGNVPLASVFCTLIPFFSPPFRSTRCIRC